MTNFSTKPSLLGRKRTKDLQNAHHFKNPVPLNQTKKVLLDLQEKWEGDEPAPMGRTSRVTFEQEAFEYLLEFHHNLKNSHQAVRVSYSLSEQNRRLLEAIKKVVNHYGDSLKQSKMSQKEINQKTQHLLDTLVSRLIREGVKLRPLSLIPER